MAFTVKQCCEKYGLDENRVFNMVLGESGSILPKARGYTGYIVENNETTFKLDCTDLASRSATATHKIKRTVTALGESSVYNYTYSLSLDLGKSTSQFQFTEKEDNETRTSVTANKVTFATSPAIVTPQRVTNKITSYINQHF